MFFDVGLKNTVNYSVFGHLTLKNYGICSGFCFSPRKNTVNNSNFAVFSCFSLFFELRWSAIHDYQILRVFFFRQSILLDVFGLNGRHHWQLRCGVGGCRREATWINGFELAKGSILANSGDTVWALHEDEALYPRWSSSWPPHIFLLSWADPPTSRGVTDIGDLVQNPRGKKGWQKNHGINHR